MKATVEEVLRSKIRDREKIMRAIRAIDAFRHKHGKPAKGFDTVTLLRKLRQTR